MELKKGGYMKVARIYLRVSTLEQNLERQKTLIDEVKKKGFYIAGIYSEKASGTSLERKELNRLLNDLQSGDWIFAESIDRITRLPPLDAEKLLDQITCKGAKLFVPEIFDFDEFRNMIPENEDLKLFIEPILELIQKLFCRIALNMSYQDWKQRKERQKQGIAIAKEKGKFKGRRANLELHKNIIMLRKQNISISQVCKTLGTSESTVLRVMRNYKKNN